MIDLSIILVNWNCMAFTEQCIASVISTVRDLEYEVIVVDNHSADAPCQSMIEKYPSVKLILSPENIGFGRANNLGAQCSKGKILFFLNPDTLLRGDSVRRMFQELLARRKAGAIGARLLNPDLTLQTSSVQCFPTILNQVFAIGALQRWWPGCFLWGKQALYAGNESPVHPVDVVSGAAIMVRRDVFEQINGFNPQYFMYAEEVDLCFALRAAGNQVLHCPKAEIVHFGGQSTSQREDGFQDVAMRDSVYRFLRRTRGRTYAALFRISLLASASLRLALTSLLSFFAKVFGKQTLVASLRPVQRKWLKIAGWSVGITNVGSTISGGPFIGSAQRVGNPSQVFPK